MPPAARVFNSRRSPKSKLSIRPATTVNNSGRPPVRPNTVSISAALP